jgi:hypothetical protein
MSSFGLNPEIVNHDSTFALPYFLPKLMTLPTVLFYGSLFNILTFNHYRWEVFYSFGCEALG